MTCKHALRNFMSSRISYSHKNQQINETTYEIAIFQTVKSKVIISLFQTVRLSVSISLRNLYNSLNSIKEIGIFQIDVNGLMVEELLDDHWVFHCGFEGGFVHKCENQILHLKGLACYVCKTWGVSRGF